MDTMTVIATTTEPPSENELLRRAMRSAERKCESAFIKWRCTPDYPKGPKAKAWETYQAASEADITAQERWDSRRVHETY
jgi:hypothetical protein